MSVDISKIRVGDFVTARLEVAQVDGADRRCPVRVKGGWLGPEEIIGHEPRAFAVGDKVRTRGNLHPQNPATVVFVYKDRLFLDWPVGYVEARAASDCEHAT